jgi:hypothetical protein
MTCDAAQTREVKGAQAAAGCYRAAQARLLALSAAPGMWDTFLVPAVT